MIEFIAHDVEQRSQEWSALRLGKLTGTRADPMLSQPKKKGDPETAGRRNLRVAMALERITQELDDEPFTTRDMKRGVEMEPEARRAYEAATGRLLSTVGFLSHPTLRAGCSPDGLYLKRDTHLSEFEFVDGVIDFKCPRPGNHLEYLRGLFPLEYRRQLTHNLWITGACWAEMVSYCPKFPESLRLCVHRMPRVDAEIDAYEAAAIAFLAEVDLEVQALETMASLRTVLDQAVA